MHLGEGGGGGWGSDQKLLIFGFIVCQLWPPAGLGIYPGQVPRFLLLFRSTRLMLAVDVVTDWFEDVVRTPCLPFWSYFIEDATLDTPPSPDTAFWH
jgi:hypothetical protein